MRVLDIFVLFYGIHIVVSDSTTNLVTFYTRFRRLCLCRCGITQSDAFHDMSWLATIYAGKNTIRGTLISDRHVITAATPLFGKSVKDVKVTLGAPDLCRDDHALNSTVEAILIHPGYYSSGKFNDLALVRLRNNVMFSKYITPICMPVFDSGEIDQLVWTPTWTRNKTEYCKSQVITLPALGSRSCSRTSVYPPEITMTDKGCLGPLGVKSIVCEEDVGSPIMIRWSINSPFRLLGVVTYASCEDKVCPLFTKIVDNMIWIHENIQQDCQCF